MASRSACEPRGKRRACCRGNGLDRPRARRLVVAPVAVVVPRSLWWRSRSRGVAPVIVAMSRVLLFWSEVSLFVFLFSCFLPRPLYSTPMPYSLTPIASSPLVLMR